MHLQHGSLLHLLDERLLRLAMWLAVLLTLDARLYKLSINAQRPEPTTQPPQHAVQQEGGLVAAEVAPEAAAGARARHHERNTHTHTGSAGSKDAPVAGKDPLDMAGRHVHAVLLQQGQAWGSTTP